MAVGISFSKVADMGMSPVNSLPYVLSEIFKGISMGTWVIIVFCIYIFIQFLILGKNFKPWRILQLICTTIFGFFTDFTNMLLDMFLPKPELMELSLGMTYVIRLIYLIISIALIALGVFLYLAPNLISLPAEGISQVIAEKIRKPFPTVKMCFDCTIAFIALIISLIYFKEFHGIREGTIIAAFGVGKVLGMYYPLKPALERFLYGNKRNDCKSVD